MLSVDALNTTIGDLQRNYLFKVLVPVLPPALSGVFPDAQTVANNMDVYTEKFKLPESANKDIGFKWGGEQVWYSGPNAAAMNVTLSLRCDRTWQAYRFFKAWKDLTGADDGQTAVVKNLTLGVIKLLTVDVDKTTVLHAVSLQNSQILKISDIEFDKGADSEIKFDVTIYYERKIDHFDSLGTV